MGAMFTSSGLRVCAVMVLMVNLAVVGLGANVYGGETAQDTEAVTGKTALDEYVGREDTAYAYSLAGTREIEGIKVHVLELTSQQWRSADEVTPNVWKHWVTLYVPFEVRTTTGLLYIGGGVQGEDAPELDPTFGKIAFETKSVVVSLSLVPNQPLRFLGEPDAEIAERGRYEDEILSYSWRKYLDTGDMEWVVHLPMVKSAVRAMDAAQAFLASDAGGGIALEHFVVTGASKRGWTTWLTAAVDERVEAIIPIVIDMLNMGPSFQHHWECYGFWAPTIHDYVDQDLMNLVYDDSKAYRRLVQLVDPYAYRNRLTLPKFLLNGSQDEFFLPDSAQFYWKGLKGPKHIRYVPNAGHNVSRGTDAIESLAAYYGAILYDVPLPEYDWERVSDYLAVSCGDQAPASVKIWRATNPKSRDFRTDVLDEPWKATPLVSDEWGVYVAKLTEPEKGWTAHFIELKFENTPGLPPFTFTTQVYVTPDTKSFAGTRP